MIIVDDGRQAAGEAAGAEQTESAARNDRILAVAPHYVVDWPPSIEERNWKLLNFAVQTDVLL